MSIKDLRSFRQVLATIRLEESDSTTTSMMGAADNAVYFTREQFARLCLPIPSLVKQFLHFTRAPSALVHRKVFQILMGCSVLNFLYQLDISLVEICFIYTLKPPIYVSPQPPITICNRTPLRLKRKGLFWLKVCGTRRRALQGFLFI